MIKKLALTALVASALFSSSSYAEENMFYVKAEGGLNFFPVSKVTTTINSLNVDTKFKSSMGGSASFGVGYYVMDNLRTELSFKYPFISEAKAKDKNNQSKLAPKSMAVFLKGYVDLYDFEVGKISIGAGLGWTQTSAELKTKDAANKDTTSKFDKKNGLGFGAGARVSYNISEAVALETGYEWTMYGKSKDAEVTVGNQKVSIKSPSIQTHELVFGLRFAI
jgi:opacity protein-like surface antigen